MYSKARMMGAERIRQTIRQNRSSETLASGYSARNSCWVDSRQLTRSFFFHRLSCDTFENQKTQRFCM